MRLIVIRHTKVAVEPGVCYGQSDVPLSESYNQEKKWVAAQLKESSVEAVYASPLSRCRQLAYDLFPKNTIVCDSRLKELDFGSWELNTWEEIYASEEGKTWMANFQTLPTQNGESYPDMRKRIESFLSELSSNGHQTVAIVTHAGVIRIMKSIVEKHPISELFETFKPEYGSISEFQL
jgi:alpha-ribazole phosphatase